MSNEKILHTKFGNAKLRKDGYYKITSVKEGNHNKYLHRLIWEDFYGCDVPKGYHIHHKNGNKLDNCILNLALINKTTHNSMHSAGENNAMYGKTHTKEVKDKIRALKVGKKLDEDLRVKLSSLKNTSGYYRVYKNYDKNRKTLFWQYQYYNEKNKRTKISSKTLEGLKEKVLAKGLPWIKLSELNSK